uniref:C-type lectin domain-containing protein n=1 Tax=Varanus komodoensis TaxID=61221 RepID=A0A8D2LVB8_VARKO
MRQTILSFAPKGDVQRVISAGWQFFDGSFYFFSQAAKSWEDAEESCTEYRAHLASVTSQREMVSSPLSHPYWPQGVRWGPSALPSHTAESENCVGRALPHWSFWSSGQPDNWDQAPQQQEDCVHFQTGVLKSWNDNSCLHKFKWICKAVFT